MYELYSVYEIIAFAERSPNAGLISIDRGKGMQHRKRIFDSPEAGAKTNYIIAKPYAVHVVSAYISWPSAMSFLISLVASFVFDVFESSLNSYFTMTFIPIPKE